MIVTIKDPNEKRVIARTVLEDLTEWFEVEESREGFIRDCINQTFLAAKENGKTIGFLCLKETGNATVELAVMGIMKEYHRNGVGRELVEKAKYAARADGYEFMQHRTTCATVKNMI